MPSAQYQSVLCSLHSWVGACHTMENTCPAMVTVYHRGFVGDGEGRGFGYK
jgi:hypothetical protein